MSFELTPKEQSRIDAAASLEMKVDPISHVDMSTIIVVSLVYAVQSAGFCFQFWNRHYPPLKAKNIPLMLSLSFGQVMWFLGDIFTGGLVHLDGSPFLRNCKLTLIWFRACLGAYMVTSLFALRCYSLYCVFHKGKPYKGKVVYTSFGIAIGSLAFFGMVSTLVPGHLTTHYEVIVDMCFTSRGYITVVLIVIWSIWVYTAVMYWKLRNISFCFNERAEIVAYFVLLLVVNILNTVCLLVIRVYPAHSAWRNSLVYINHVCASVGYWAIMWEPTYQCAFHRAEYLQHWIKTLAEGDMEKQYSYITNPPDEATQNLMQSVDGMAAVHSGPYPPRNDPYKAHADDTKGDEINYSLEATPDFSLATKIEYGRCFHGSRL
ncbi:hypothetical protein GQ54DRAFT_279181 [Martensiomyces pterosporus]|nr:hypothetical protein GQ54DRAFT_279181 [Martensiomyces pterosporus]